MGGNWVGSFIFVGVLGCSLEWSASAKGFAAKSLRWKQAGFKKCERMCNRQKKNHKLEKKKQGLIATLKIKNAKLTTTCTCKKEKIRAL